MACLHPVPGVFSSFNATVLLYVLRLTQTAFVRRVSQRLTMAIFTRQHRTPLWHSCALVLFVQWLVCSTVFPGSPLSLSLSLSLSLFSLSDFAPSMLLLSTLTLVGAEKQVIGICFQKKK
eukprot:RCo021706